MIQKSPSIRIRMTSLGLWSLEGTPGILEVYNHVDSPPEDRGDDSNHKRAEVASKLLETLENFNYDETAEPSDYISGWLSGSEAAVELPSIFEDFAALPTPPALVPSSRPAVPSGPGGFYGSRACAVPSAPVTINKLGYESSPSSEWNSTRKVGYEASALWHSSADEYSSSLYAPPTSADAPLSGTQWTMESMYQGVPNELTPPHSPPNMYERSPKRPLQFEDLPDELLKPTVSKELNYENLSVESSNIKEENNNGQLIMSLLAEMDQKDIDEIVQCSVEQNFVIGPGTEANFGVTSTNFVESLSPEHSCSSSDTNFGYHSESDRSSSCGSDPDYNPFSPPEVNRKSAKDGESFRSSGRKATKISEPNKSARAIKPYARKAPVPVEDKKLRKKEQNKNAATRYRIKKKAEIEVILGEESELKEKNDELKKSVEDLNREIKFMKKFMRDFFKTQGVLK